MDFELLPSAPYPDGVECPAVDVHASGEAFLACTSTRVAVRSTVNGAAFFVIDTGGYIRSARFSPEGGTILVATTIGDLRTFDARTGATIASVAAGADSEAFVPADGSILAAAKGEVSAYDGRTLAKLRVITRGSADTRVSSIATNRDGTRIVLAAGPSLVCVAASSGVPSWVRRFDIGDVGRVALTPDESTVVCSVSGHPGGIVATRLSDGQPGWTYRFTGPRGVAWTTAAPGNISASGTDAAAEAMKKLGIDPSTLAIPKGPSTRRVSYPSSPVISRDGAHVLSNLPDGKLVVLDTATGEPRATPTEPRFIESVAWLPDATRALVGGADGRIGIYGVGPAFSRIVELPSAV